MNKGVLETYLVENQKSFYRLAYSYTKDPDSALDVVQEAIVKAMEKFHTLRNPEYMKTWFYRVLVNEGLTYIRKNGKTVLREDGGEDDLPAAAGEDIAQRLDLYDAVQKLEPGLRTIIILRFFEDMKLEDIAKVTETNLSTVKSRLYKALHLLKLDLQE